MKIAIITLIFIFAAFSVVAIIPINKTAIAQTNSSNPTQGPATEFQVTGNPLSVAGNPGSVSFNFQFPWKGVSGPAGLITKFYEISLGIAGALALGVIVYGGILWTASGAAGTKDEAKKWITGAIWGIVLLLGAVLILNTINPQLITLTNPVLNSVLLQNPNKIKIEDYVNVGKELITTIPSGVATNDQAYAFLKNRGIVVTSTTGCLGVDAKGCTTLQGITSSALDQLVNLKMAAGLTDGELIVVGANEKNGHGVGTNHGNGRTFDIEPNTKINTYLLNLGVQPVSTKVVGDDGTINYWPVYTTANGTKFLWEGNHWHIAFPYFSITPR